ncbi:hypothetical protein HYV58_01720 [Candidatus Peregrinibacteria bacterium]|nr:hypothetical protein [Candidatus Peregrinibacteria bacterium]
MKKSSKTGIAVGVAVLVVAAVFFAGRNGSFKGAVVQNPASYLGVFNTLAAGTEITQPGARNVRLLGFGFRANRNPVVVKGLSFRVVADDDGAFDNGGYGDTAANSLVENVSLFRVTSGVGGEVQTWGTAQLRPARLASRSGQSISYYVASFDSLNYTINPNTTEKWFLRANLKPGIAEVRYLAADIIPGNDVKAVDGVTGQMIVAQNDRLRSSVYAINNLGKGNPDFSVKIVPVVAQVVGTLVAAQENSPPNGIVVGGQAGIPMAKYKFRAENEAFTVQKLDVVVDSDNDFTDNPSNDTGGNNVTRVGLSYTKQDGTTEVAYSSLSAGTAAFAGLNFYVPRGGSAYIMVLADINTIEFGAISGSTIRLGLSERADANNAFEAQGEGSAERVIAPNTPSAQTYVNSSGVPTVVVRKTVPTVAKLSTAATRLNNGLNDIAAITIRADIKEAVAVKRMAIEYVSAGVRVNGLELYRKMGSGSESNITTQVSLRNRAGNNLKAGGSPLAEEGRGSTLDTIYITWDKSAADQEFISKGVTNTYTLRATVTGAGTGDSLSTYIVDDTVRLGTTADNSNTAGSVLGLRTNQDWPDPTTSAASVNNTRLVWRFLSPGRESCAGALTNLGCVYIDADGNGTVTAATDPSFVLAEAGLGQGHIAGATTTSTLSHGGIIPGVMYYTTDNVIATTVSAGIYWDLNVDEDYSTAADIAVGLIADSGTGGPTDNALVTQDFRYTTGSGNGTGGPTDNALVTQDFRYTTGSGNGVYIDATAGNTFAAASDHLLTTGSGNLLAGLTTAPANNAEIFTSNFNFIWSDNSAASHATTTNDWTNGVDIPSLPTQTLSLSF